MTFGCCKSFSVCNDFKDNFQSFRVPWIGKDMRVSSRISSLRGKVWVGWMEGHASHLMPPKDKTCAHQTCEIANMAARARQATTSRRKMRIVFRGFSLVPLLFVKFGSANMNFWCLGSHHFAMKLKSDDEVYSNCPM